MRQKIIGNYYFGTDQVQVFDLINKEKELFDSEGDKWLLENLEESK